MLADSAPLDARESEDELARLNAEVERMKTENSRTRRKMTSFCRRACERLTSAPANPDGCSICQGSVVEPEPPKPPQLPPSAPTVQVGQATSEAPLSVDGARRS